MPATGGEADGLNGYGNTLTTTPHIRQAIALTVCLPACSNVSYINRFEQTAGVWIDEGLWQRVRPNGVGMD